MPAVIAGAPVEAAAPLKAREPTEAETPGRAVPALDPEKDSVSLPELVPREAVPAPDAAKISRAEDEELADAEMTATEPTKPSNATADDEADPALLEDMPANRIPPEPVVVPLAEVETPLAINDSEPIVEPVVPELAVEALDPVNVSDSLPALVAGVAVDAPVEAKMSFAELALVAR